jgi:hypothetical protein
MHAVDSPVFDADNHYYEALDAFTRHLDPAKLGPRVIEWVDINGRKYHAIGGRVSRAVTNPTFDPDHAARSAGRLLPGQPRRPSHARAPGQARADPSRVPRPRRPPRHHGRAGPRPRSGSSPPSACSTRKRSSTTRARSSSCSAPSTAGWPRTGAWPTRTASSPPRTSRWPTSTRRSASWSGRSTKGCPGRGHAGRRPDHGGRPPLSPADEMFDPFWARVNEAGITVVVHAGDAGLSSNGYAPDGFSASFRRARPAEHQDVRH